MDLTLMDMKMRIKWKWTESLMEYLMIIVMITVSKGALEENRGI